jgi:very-short-patch-repair endonuclease
MIIIEKHLIKTKSTKNLPKNRELIYFSKKNRRAGILAEVLFWQQVHKGKFYGINFNRQKVIGNYIVDFYVPSLSLVIEIDGWSHNYFLKPFPSSGGGKHSVFEMLTCRRLPPFP